MADFARRNRANIQLLSKLEISFFKLFRSMANRALCVLSISYDESLLRTREWILKAAGFDVTSALGFIEAADHCRNSSFDLVIIGHSLPQTDKAALVQEVRKHNHTRILGLSRYGEEPLPDVDHSVDPFTSRALIDAVRTVLKKREDTIGNS